MKKIAIIGAGPGGYVAAIRAAQLGAKVDLIEAEAVGGTCLNVGCIPTKALLHTAELYREISEGKSMGIETDKLTVNWPKVMSQKSGVVKRLVGGVEGLLKANGVTVHRGYATLVSPRQIALCGGRKIEADTIIVAVGSEPVTIPFPGHDLPGVIDSTGALSLPEQPASVVIMGGGVIGVEFAALYRAFGAEVTIVEMLPEILPSLDAELAAMLRQELTRQGVKILTGAKLTGVKQDGKLLMAEIAAGNSQQMVKAEYVLVAVGRKPRTGGMGLEKLGVNLDRGRIKVDKNFMTNIPGIYAIGDCNGQMMLAHAASAQGVAAVEHAMGHKNAYYGDIIPACVYTHPEAAGVGLTEEQAIAKGIQYQVGRFPLAGNGKTLIECGGTGLVKILCGKKYGEIIGVHIFGPRATDLIAEAALAIRLEATVDELISTIHAHPTVSEAMAEAALAVNGISIHWPPQAKL